MGQARWPSGAGDEMPGMGAAGQRDLLVEPSLWLQLDKLDVASSLGSCSFVSSLVGLCCHVSPALADTSIAVAARERMNVVVRGEAMQAFFCYCLSHHDPRWVAHHNDT